VRQDKLHLCFLILLLALGVAAREAPEIMSLTDDFSNEGMVVGYENPPQRLTIRRASEPEKLRAKCLLLLIRSNLKQKSWPTPPLVLQAGAGQGRLRFLSIQRT
jgi:hypothetical protein